MIYADPSHRDAFDRNKRLEGRDWPKNAHTMVGMARLDNLQHCLRRVLHDGVPGDLIETGVWRGGASIFMKALLEVFGASDRDAQRRVFVADSFEGLPPPNPELYPHDEGIDLYKAPQLAIPRRVVESNFRRYGLLDERVVFLEGFFADTLPHAPIEKLAIMRLDGDLYESTMDALVNLYPKLSAGGYCIVDDYGAIEACREAVHDYRRDHGITDEIVPVDWTGAYWRRSG